MKVSILPLAVISSLPVGLFGSFFLLEIMGLANDAFTARSSGQGFRRSAGKNAISDR